jgi:hypothetical protein
MVCLVTIRFFGTGDGFEIFVGGQRLRRERSIIELLQSSHMDNPVWLACPFRR